LHKSIEIAYESTKQEGDMLY